MNVDEVLRAVRSRKLSPAEAARLIKLSRERAAQLDEGARGPEQRVELESIREMLVSTFAKALYMEPSEVERDKSFVDMGLDSIIGVEWIKEINRRLALELPATTIYDYSTIDQFAEHLARARGAPIRTPEKRRAQPMDQAEQSAHLRAPIAPEQQRQRGDLGLVVSRVHTLDEACLSQWRLGGPGVGEITVRVKASGVNFPDVMCVNGLYPTMPSYPFVPGFEVAGVVVDRGEGATEFEIGDEVVGLTGPRLGGHADLVNLPQQNAVRKPSNVSFAEACSLPVAFGIVHYAFELAELRAGEQVLIQTATGGCGLVALQLAHLRGARCIGTSSREHKLEILRRLNVEHAVNYKTPFDEVIKELTDGRGVDVVLNMLSGDAIQRGLNCLAPSGRYLEIAVHALKTSPKLSLSHLLQNQSFHSIDLRSLSLSTGVTARESLEIMVRLLEQKKIVPIVSRLYPFARISEALEFVGRGQHIGKVVVSHDVEDVVDLTEDCIRALLDHQDRTRRSRADELEIEAPSRTVSLGRIGQAQDHAEAVDRTDAAAIAVIGVSGQFPKSTTLEQFWRNIAQGENCVTEVSRNRWPVEDFYSADPQAVGKTNCKWLGELTDADKFDPQFFNISPNEALFMDPQQRLLLQSSWSCIEDAGIDPTTLSGAACGVFVGVAPGDYGHISDESGLSSHALMGKSLSILAARISFFLNLKGPCITLDTACSSALVAIAEACNHLQLGVCKLALAGGVNVMAGPGLHIMTSKAEMLSADGRCYTFDQRANGFVPAEGVGVVLLKRLTDAQRDGDSIQAVIRGWGVNQDGRTNGITAPSANSQAQLEAEVYQKFGIDPASITLVEAHGTGTKLGDPIEVRALTDSFRRFTRDVGFCALGSIKSNIGHAMAAAGIAGFIKVVLALKHKQLPPTINFERLNEHVQIADTPFYINTALKPWNVATGQLRRAAVSSFGFSGTNAHVVVEEGPREIGATMRDRRIKAPCHLIALSARTGDQLKAQASRLLEYLDAHEDIELGDVSYTLLTGRKHFKHRLAMLVDDLDHLKAALHQWAVTGHAEGVLAAGPSERREEGRDQNKDQRKLIEQSVADCAAFGVTYRNAAASGEVIDSYREKLSLLLENYVEGGSIEFSKLFAGGRCRRVSLPTYPFEKRRLWLDGIGSAVQSASGDRSSSATAAASAPSAAPPSKPLEAPAGAVRTKLALRGAQAAIDPQLLSARAPAQSKIALSQRLFSEPAASTAPSARGGQAELATVLDYGRGVFCIEMKDALGRNAVSPELLSQIRSHLRTIAELPAAKVVLLKGGEEDFAQGSEESLPMAMAADVLTLSSECELPTFAVSKGACTGLGWLLASQCDLLICGEESAQDYVRAPGRAPLEWERAYLTRRFGHDLASALLDPSAQLTGASIKEGRFGVATAPRAQIDSLALQIAHSLAAMPRQALCELKKHYARPSAAFVRALQEGAEGTMRRLRSLHSERRIRQRSWLELSGIADAATDDDFGSPREVELSSALVRMVELGNGVVEIQLRDVEHKNMLSPELVAGIGEAFSKVAGRTDYSVVILTGYDQYFSLGGNKQSLEAIQQGAARFSDTHIYSVALDCELPVIAAVQGHGIGAGWALGLYADYVILSSESMYSSPYMGFGFTPGAGATLVFPYQFGQDLGREILFTAREYQGKELAARHSGLVVLPRSEVGAHARRLAARLARVPRAQLILAKNERCSALRENIAATYEQELAMHELTFVGNAAVLEAIQHRFATDADAAQDKRADEARSSAVHTQKAALQQSELLAATLNVLRSTLADQLGVGEEEIRDDVEFMELGLDSVVGVTWIRKVNQAYDLAIAVTKVYQYPTLRAFAEYVSAERLKHDDSPAAIAGDSIAAESAELSADRADGEPKASAELDEDLRVSPLSDARALQSDDVRNSGATSGPEAPALDRAIAVVGMAGRFPLSNSVEEFWRNIATKTDCIREVTRWSLADYFDPDRSKQHKSYSKWMGAMEGVDEFDPLFFNISPQEALAMDPQQRLFLMAAWECIEDAGYDPVSLAGSRCGVFVGCGPNDYGYSHDKGLNAEALTGSSNSILAGRVSYFLNLRGPCVAIDTACSSSLVAVAQACDSLVLDNCDAALAGGVCVMAGPTIHIMTSNAGMLSPDGRCHAFDCSANGFVPGEGVGVVLLKRLKDAVAAGDHIDGVLRAWGVNQDGKTNGITAPNPESQASLQREVYGKFKIDPSEIQLIETHGTGTKLGDPIEIEALVDSFGGYTKKRGYCALGSVKSNVGHLQAAAGVASLIKVVMALKRRQLPPTINFTRLNEFIDLERSPFYVNTELKPWLIDASERRHAAISSFGFSGTNAHAVLTEHVGEAADQATASRALILLSAQTSAQLREQCERLRTRVETLRAELTPGDSGASLLASIAYTLQAGRHPMEERLALVVESVDELAGQLDAYLDGKPDARRCVRGAAKRQDAGAKGFAADDELQAAVARASQALELESLAELWVRGAAIDWALVNRAMFGGRVPRRISLPTYPFARESYWLGGFKGAQSREKASGERSGSLARPTASSPRSAQYSLPKNLLLTAEHWEESPLQLDEDSLRAQVAAKGAQRVLILHRRGANPETLRTAILQVWSGFTNKLLIEALNVDAIEPAANVLDDYLANHAAPDVLFLVSGADVESGDVSEHAQQLIGEREIQTVLLVAQTLLKRAGAKSLELYHCYVHSHAVANVYREGLAGLFRAIAMECPPHRYRSIACAQLAELSDYKIIVREWLTASPASHAAVQVRQVKYEQERRYASRFEERSCATRELASTSVFREGATYLMVGALGEAGQQLCLELARAYRPRLIILSRRPGDREIDRALRQLEEAGAKVLYRSVDITDADELHKVLRGVKAEVGDIHGVFHLARAVDDGRLQDKTFESFKQTTAAKVVGTLNVDRSTADEPLEFFIVFSSMAAFGIAGSADYAYATAFQNAFIRERNRRRLQNERRGVSVAFCWGQWTVDAYSNQERDAALAQMGFGFIDAPFALHTMGIALHELARALEQPGADAIFAGDVLGAMAVNDAEQVKQLYGLIDRREPSQDARSVVRPVDHGQAVGVDDRADEFSIEELVAATEELDGDDGALRAVLADRSYAQLNRLYESLTAHAR